MTKYLQNWYQTVFIELTLILVVAVYKKQLELFYYKESLAIIGNFTTFAPKEIVDRIVTKR